MTGRIDHAGWAKGYIADAENAFDPNNLNSLEEATVEQNTALAQVHATLALVEQQRIANLIALGQYRIIPSDMPVWRSVVFLGEDLKPEIREGLGLL